MHTPELGPLCACLGWNHHRKQVLLCGWLMLVVAMTATPAIGADRPPTPAETAATVDALMADEFHRVGVEVAARCNDADFLRRISLDILGQIPTPASLRSFLADTSPTKREALVTQLLEREAYGENWARYWRDVVYSTTELRGRIGQPQFEAWIGEQLNTDQGWDRVATAMITATGKSTEHGETAIFAAHQAQPEEVAAEVSRIFLGIQLQCANCHNHPTDIWKREQFHELAAYFPRVTYQLTRTGDGPQVEIASLAPARERGRAFFREHPDQLFRRFDDNHDQRLTKAEVQAVAERMGEGAKQFARQFDRLLKLADRDQDQQLSLEELKAVPMPNRPGRGRIEHHMPDLNQPGSEGAVMHPRFFVNQSSPGEQRSDDERRSELARQLTSTENPWFARAFVNRIWTELLGDGFYTPVDDLGPTRTARFPAVLDQLAADFVRNQHQPKWLIETIIRTAAYQRALGDSPTAEESLPFQSASATRLRADQVFDSLLQALSEPEDDARRLARQAAQNAKNKTGAGGPAGMRIRFDRTFGVDPSTPKADVITSVPQALVLMNGQPLRQAISAKGRGRLSQLLRSQSQDAAVVDELFASVLCRMPTASETEQALAHVGQVGREVGFEDLYWALLNTTEFVSRR